MKVSKSLGLALVVALFASVASAQSFRYEFGLASDVLPGAVGAEVPADALVISFFADSGSERLVSWQDVEAVVNGGTIYNNGFGSNTQAPNPALVAAFPALAADSYANMQGNQSTSTSALTNEIGDDDNPFGDPTRIKQATWADTASTSTNGTERQFAQITLIPDATDVPASITFLSGSLFQAAVGGVPNQVPGSDLSGITIAIPEPSVMLLTLAGVIGLVAIRRRNR